MNTLNLSGALDLTNAQFVSALDNAVCRPTLTGNLLHHINLSDIFYMSVYFL